MAWPTPSKARRGERDATRKKYTVKWKRPEEARSSIRTTRLSLFPRNFRVISQCHFFKHAILKNSNSAFFCNLHTFSMLSPSAKISAKFLCFEKMKEINAQSVF